MPCVIKYEYEDGTQLPTSKQPLWCGKHRRTFEWYFIDAQHAALADKPICNRCRANIIKALKNEE